MRKNRQRKNPFGLAVKKRLLERGLSATALARKLGYARNTVNMAINRLRRFPRVEAAIREELGI